MSVKFTTKFQTSTAGNLHGQENEVIMQAARAGALAKVFPPQPAWSAIAGQFADQDTSLQRFPEVVMEVLRQTEAARGGCHPLTTAERQNMRAQIISMMGGTPTAGYVTLVNVIVGLRSDFDVPTPPASKSASDKFAGFKPQVEEITKWVVESIRARTSAGRSR
jgi:hypothetical protein